MTNQLPPPPPSGTPSPPPSGGAGTPPAPHKNFWARLFDLSFTEWVTPSVAAVLYVLAIGVATLHAAITLFFGLANLSDSPVASIIVVILAPVLWLIFVVYSRVIIEVLVALIRTAQNTRELADRNQG